MRSPVRRPTLPTLYHAPTLRAKEHRVEDDGNGQLVVDFTASGTIGGWLSPLGRQAG